MIALLAGLGRRHILQLAGIGTCDGMVPTCGGGSGTRGGASGTFGTSDSLTRRAPGPPGTSGSSGDQDDN